MSPVFYDVVDTPQERFPRRWLIGLYVRILLPQIYVADDIYPLITRLSVGVGIPTMIGMLISALYNAIDAYFVSGLGMSQMGAVSVVFPIVQIVIGLGMMFGAGASSYISRLLGKGDNAEANRTASTALFASIFVHIDSSSLDK